MSTELAASAAATVPLGVKRPSPVLLVREDACLWNRASGRLLHTLGAWEHSKSNDRFRIPLATNLSRRSPILNCNGTATRRPILPFLENQSERERDFSAVAFA